MSMSLHIYGVKPVNDHYRKMKSVYESCADLGVAIPTEVLEFFNYEVPRDEVRVDLSRHEAVVEDDMGYRFTVDLNKLPNDIKVLRFIVDW